jgi:tetratricopeptide (TPR) repeat protein
MIVRDEEETVGRAIKSALAVVDEVVVVDTGSTDNTRLIVEGYGARIIDHPWTDDFSAARNAALAAAYGDWILVLDADEVLESVRPVEMGTLLANDRAIAYYARIRDEVRGRQTMVYDKVRMFRNHPGIRYRYPIHEQIAPSIAHVAEQIGGEFLSSGLTITHYARVDKDERIKSARNQRLLSRAIASYPEEPYFRYQIACETAVYLEERVLPVKGFGQMLTELERAVQLVEAMSADTVPHLGYGPDLYARLATALLTARREEEAVTVAERAIRRFGMGSLSRFTLGMALLSAPAENDEASARRRRAVECMEGMLAESQRLETAPVSAAYFSLYPLRYLGLAALEEGDLLEARRFFYQALELDGSYTGALTGLAQLAEREGRLKEALQIYLRALSIDDNEVEAWRGGAEVLCRLGFGDNARSWLTRLQRLLPEHPDLERLEQMARDPRELVGRS